MPYKLDPLERKFSYPDSNKMQFNIPCKHCQQETRFTVKATDYRKYCENKRKFKTAISIAEIFPYLSWQQVSILTTGFCSLVCWNTYTKLSEIERSGI